MAGACHQCGKLHQLLKHQQPDVILMDINLPDVNGIELCRQVRSMYPGCNVLGLSTFNQHAVIRK